ncbi:MAG: hypothetical protein JNK82_22405 [Myxococcaceae bacterium]|nr:hypothetical protein [Myxococcaceae bacterium]
MWLLVLVLVVALGVLAYLRGFLKGFAAAPTAQRPSDGTSTLSASDVTSHAVHQAAWSQVTPENDV